MPKLEISKVHDAYEQGGECPLCTLMDGAEATYVKSFQHSRVMEPNVRVRTNEAGFCPEHYRKLYAGENKLGLGLVVHTHLLEKLPSLRASLESLVLAIAGGRKGTARIEAAAASLSSLKESCFICGLLRGDRDRYVFTILYLWGKDPEFPATLRASRGFCIGHFLDLLTGARASLKGDRLQRWCAEVVPLMTASLEHLEKDLFAFTQLHHDANRGLGTEEQRTALGRTLQKLAGGRFRLE